MLDKLSLQNFKAFKELNDLEFKPITILCGTNSCGKSSILQSLLLFKQTIESQNIDQVLQTNGKIIRLGKFSNIFFRNNLNNPLKISLELDFCPKEFYAPGKTKSRSITSILRDIIEEVDTPGDRIPSREILNSNFRIKYTVKLKVINDKKSKKSNQFLIPEEIGVSIFMESERSLITKKLPRNSVKSSLLSSVEKNVEINLRHLNDDQYNIFHSMQEIFLSGVIRKKSKDPIVASIEFANLFPISFEIISKDDSQKDYRGYSIDPFSSGSEREILRKLYRVSDLLQLLLSSCRYIGPLREQPQRRYIYENEVSEVGYRGENAAYIYMAEKDKPIELGCYYNNDRKRFDFLFSSFTLSEYLKTWFQILGVSGFDTDPASDEVISLSLGADPFSNTVVNVADVGFGISQIFPILLEGIRMDAGQTLLLEQPEIHLHPKLQMQMADFFISLALCDKNMIIETHSDHIINRLIRRIVEDDSLNLKNLIKIYFVKQSEDGSLCEEIQIDDSMGIVNWPDGFFDQVASEQQKILMAGIKKRKARRNKEAEQS